MQTNLDIDRISELAYEQAITLTNALLTQAGVKPNDIFLSKKSTQALADIVVGTLNTTMWKPKLVDSMAFHMPMSSIQHFISSPLKESIENFLTKDYKHALDERVKQLQESVQHTIGMMADYQSNLKYKNAKHMLTAQDLQGCLKDLGNLVCSNATLHMTVKQKNKISL